MHMLSRPWVVFVLGVLAGAIVAPKLRSLPGLNKLPSVG
jgi:hypothetical protein